MIIWHAQLLDASPVGGVWRSVARLASGLANDGHIPVLLQRADRTDTDYMPRRDSNGVMIARVPLRRMMFDTRSLSELAADFPPDLIHLHWGFLPHHAGLAQWADRRGIPYAYQGRGALAEGALHRRAVRKHAYLALIERRLVQRAALAVGSTAGDLQDFLGIARDFAGETAIVPNAVVSSAELPRLMSLQGADDRSGTGLCGYLGRWDIKNKGIDRMVTVARAAPDAQFRFHTDLRPTRNPRLAAKVLRSMPSNVEVAPPLVGDAKWSVLSSLAIYLQLSRWESFGNAVAEAMVAGTPVVVSREMHIADIVREQQVGLVVDGDDPAAAAASITALLADSHTWHQMGLRAQEYGHRSFTTERVTSQMLDAYRSVLR